MNGFGPPRRFILVQLFSTCLVSSLISFSPLAHSEIKTITLIEYNDLHAHLTQHKDIVKTSTGTQVIKAGGLHQNTIAVCAAYCIDDGFYLIKHPEV